MQSAQTEMTGIKRLIFSHFADRDRPTLVFIGGIHGNEPSGALALQRVFSLHPNRYSGNVYALAGNLRALRENRRYIDQDLNRAWLRPVLGELEQRELSASDPSEWNDLKALNDSVLGIIQKHGHRQLVFIDLHTTSSSSCPFLPFNDALMNREVAERFKVPLILGIEEYLEGSFMSYINDLNFPALAFEAGSHADPASIDRHEAFILLCMHYCGVAALQPGELQKYQAQLDCGEAVAHGFYEILHRHAVAEASQFQMQPGYSNFDSVQSGELLAIDHGERIMAPMTGRIFMPLYQDQGNEGFFIIHRVSSFWLRASAILRKWQFQRILAWLPGIHKHPVKARTYLANPRVTRIFHREIFHLLGFRMRRTSEHEIELIQRD